MNSAASLHAVFIIQLSQYILMSR